MRRLSWRANLRHHQCSIAGEVKDLLWGFVPRMNGKVERPPMDGKKVATSQRVVCPPSILGPHVNPRPRWMERANLKGYQVKATKLARDRLKVIPKARVGPEIKAMVVSLDHK